MWHQQFNCNVMKLRKYFLCAKKKIMTLFCNFFSSLLVFDALSWQYHNACICIPLFFKKAQHIRVVRQKDGSCVSSTTHMGHGTLVKARRRLTQKRRNCWIILVFFAHKNYSCSFIKCWLNHWCHIMDYFNDVLTTFLVEMSSSWTIKGPFVKQNGSSDVKFSLWNHLEKKLLLWHHEAPLFIRVNHHTFCMSLS